MGAGANVLAPSIEYYRNVGNQYMKTLNELKHMKQNVEE
jgi:hypothetical protein